VDNESGYARWKKAFDSGEAGFYSIGVAEFVAKAIAANKKREPDAELSKKE
jgi:hypothetical protein